MENDSAPVWFAMSAPYRRELRAKEFLDSKGVECFIPMKEALVERPGGEYNIYIYDPSEKK